ncbi:MAG: hypothetical protein QXJ23_09510 [Thermofilum sp.]|uniref:DUF2341 domain-containing protein n=1 Tax=Thermofilum sp. TaxID=1961369 RepID=UPI003177F2D9
MNWRKLSVWAILLQLLFSIVALAVPPASLAPSWYDTSVPPGYIALYKSGTKTVSPFYGWVPPGYDYWFLRAVTSSSFPTPLSATFTVSSSQDTQIQPYLIDEAFTQTGSGIQAYALPVALNQGWNLVFLKKSSTPSASGMWAYVTVTDWSQIRFGDSTGSPSNYLPYSIIWSNSTHAQVLVSAPQPGTYYLYWQNQIQVPAVNITHPFYACYSNICGVRFNGINQYAKGWVAKNWFTTNASSVVWQFYVFPNQTLGESWLTPTSSGFQVLQGQLASDPSFGGLVLYVPSGTPRGYIASASFPTGISGKTEIIVTARASGSTASIRIEVYDNSGSLVSSVTRSVNVSSSYIHYLTDPFIAYPNKQYTVKLAYQGGGSLYVSTVRMVHLLGSVGYDTSVHNTYIYSANTYSYVISTSGSISLLTYYNPFAGRLQTVTSTVNNTLQALYSNTSLVQSKSYSSGLRQINSYIMIGYPWGFFYGLTTKALGYNRSLTASEVSAVNTGAVPSNGLLFYFVADPRYLYDINWDGQVDWQDLSGNGNHVTFYNFHSRGSFTGSVMNVYAYFVTGSPKINVYYVSGSGKTTITWVPFGALVTVKDQNGNTVYSGYGQGLPLSLSLSPGTYTVTMSAGGSMLNDLSVQPFYTLSTTVTVSSSSGVAVAPHLYDWYLSGGFLYAQDSQTLNIASTFTLATMVRNVFTTNTAILTKRYYLQTLESTTPPPSCTNYDIYGLLVTSSGLPQAVLTTSSPSTKTVTDNANLGLQSNNQYVSLVGQYDGTYLKLYRNVTAVFSSNIGSVSLLQCPSMFTVGWSSNGSYVYGYVSYATLHTVVWSQNSISQMVNGKTVNMTGLVMFVDPTFWDGSKYVDLSGNGNHLYPSGSVGRVDATAKWLWVINGKGTAGGISFYYLPVGSMVYISSSTTSYWFIATSSNMYVSLPAGTYTVTLYIAGGSAPSSPPQTITWGDGIFGTDAGLFTSTLMSARSTGARNWLNGYTYRKEIVIQGSPAGAQTKYPVPIIVYYGSGTDTGNIVYLNGKAKQDFLDVVFTAGDGKTVLPVWVEESLPGVYMVAWVEVPVIPSFPSTASIYMYYGGQGSPRISPSQYIEVFDEYPTGTSVTTYGSGSPIVYQFGNVKGLLIKQTNSSGALSVVAKWARQGRVIARLYFNSTNSDVGFYEGWSDGTTFSNGRPTQSLLAFMFPSGLQLRNQWTSLLASKSTNIQSNTWYRFEARWYTSYMEAWLSSGALTEASTAFAVTAPATANYNYLTFGVNSSGTMIVDYIVLMNAVYPDVYVVGAMPEEKAGLVVPTLPTGNPVAVAPIQDPSLQQALSDPVARYLLEMMFVFALFIAITRFEPRLPVALAGTGIIVTIVGFLIGDTNLVVIGAVLVAVGVAWGLM